MNENNEVMTEETTVEPIDNSVDDWDDVDVSDLTDTAEDTADEQEEEPAQEAEQTDEPEPEPDADQQNAQEDGEREAPQQEETFELKHLGETRTVGREEITALAQKGMDYDHIRVERDSARDRVKELEGFLNEISGGMTIEELIDQTRAEMLVQRENIDKSVALQRVKLDRDRKALEAERAASTKAQADKQAEEQRRREDLTRFVKEFPGVEVNSIPKEIWLEVGKGMPLTDAYRRYENNQLKAKVAELETKVKNSENKQRSTGSQTTAGQDAKYDKWFEGWDD